MKRILTVYYSKTGENWYKDGLADLKKGNTEIAAEFIYKTLGGAIFQIEPTNPYPYSYKECCAVAEKEKLTDARPPIKGFYQSLEDIDTIFVCYPLWYDSVPMCILTFLEHYDLSGKVICPLCTHEGSGLGSSVLDLQQHFPGAEIREGLEVRGYQVMDEEKKITQWARRNAEEVRP